MAKEKSKDKSSKKSKVSDPVADATKKIKKEKKEKKSKLSSKPDVAEKLLEALSEKEGTSSVAEASKAVAEVTEKVEAGVSAGEGMIVPFADPLVREKDAKKVFKAVKKAAKNKTLKRGVKEVVKCLRKSPLATASSTSAAHGIVVLAADISPADVISHIPVLCEDHGIPYVFVASRAELGAAGATKRPTSVVMVIPGRGKGKKGEEAEETEGFKEAYDDVVAVVDKAQRSVLRV
ncbi:L30e-like protein [Ascodesmis nigricans]|uniref:L30e-like protein n=1 Tax=Ascodesmis nigricans TaxID=341454 RepID=A0A4V3SIW6_9PEZI|nr:L30e-like protein [Ascodesmis nigricans]